MARRPITVHKYSRRQNHKKVDVVKHQRVIESQNQDKFTRETAEIERNDNRNVALMERNKDKLKEKADELSFGIKNADEVRFWTNGKYIITSDVELLRNGMRKVKVGSVVKNVWHETTDSIVRENYPDYSEISLFNDLNYHSSNNKKNRGKITKYGMNKFTLEFSDYKPLITLELLNPVKSGNKDNFGKIVNKATLYQWHYIVLDSDLEGGLRVKYSVHNDYPQSEEIKYQSSSININEEDKAIKLFKEIVQKYKDGKFR